MAKKGSPLTTDITDSGFDTFMSRPFPGLLEIEKQRIETQGYSYEEVAKLAEETNPVLTTVSIKQSNLTGAKPPLTLEQDDVDEDIVEITATTGVGNAVESVGTKTLTVTDFVKITLNGSTKYIQLGDIA
jgi:hypothetical protein